MKLEEQLGFRSSFNFVPERYKVSPDIRKQLCECGFEVGVHGLIHDGKLFRSKKIFEERSRKINHYINQWGACGFRSPAMHHNLDWIHMLDIEYDASTFDTDPFEPQSDGCGKIFPYWVNGNSVENGYVELPYTLPQDFTVFILFRDYNLKIWQKKLDWLVDHGAMVLLNTHPDYMSFDNNKRYDEYHVQLYRKLLEYIKEKYCGQYWHALPKEVSKFWKNAVIVNGQGACLEESCCFQQPGSLQEAGITNLLRSITMPISRDWDRARVIVPLFSLLLFCLWLSHCERGFAN